ncbi:MAG: hypothetical protein GY880_30155 [Planctomycetaceae bacterium]|nr:hypothetical protein [Planctomycetaceae bacterium]
MSAKIEASQDPFHNSGSRDEMTKGVESMSEIADIKRIGSAPKKDWLNSITTATNKIGTTPSRTNVSSGIGNGSKKYFWGRPKQEKPSQTYLL